MPRNMQRKEELSRDMRNCKLALFIQQFEKEGSLRPHERRAPHELLVPLHV